MRLLALTHSLSTIDGVGRYSVSVLKEAQRFCEDIHVLVGRKHRGISPDFPSQIRVEASLPPGYLMYMSKPKFFYFVLSRIPKVYFAARRVDLVHCLCDYPFSLLAWIGAKAAGKPLLVSGHGTYSVAPFRFPLHRMFLEKSYKGADAVIFGSDFARRKFEEKAQFDHVGVVDYGVDVSSYLDLDPPLPDRVKPPYLLCIGELKERKGHEISMPVFIRAAKKFPELTYAVVGNYVPDDPYFLARVAELEQHGLKDRVVFLGNVDEEQKRALYAHCEAFILTPQEGADGSFEALGLVYLEAGASGVPVIGTLDSGAVCAIEHGKNGFLIDPAKPEEGAGAIAKIMTDQALKKSMGEQGKAMARAREWRRVGEKLERIYGRVVSGQPPFAG